MKNLKKIWNWIKKNKCLTILLILATILVIVFGVFAYTILNTNNDEKYFNRIDESTHVTFTEEQKVLIEEAFVNENVESVKIIESGKLLKVFIYYLPEVTESVAKSIVAGSTLVIAEETKNYYDFEYFLISTDEENETFPIIGSLHKTSTEISW